MQFQSQPRLLLKFRRRLRGHGHDVLKGRTILPFGEQSQSLKLLVMSLELRKIALSADIGHKVLPSATRIQRAEQHRVNELGALIDRVTLKPG